MKTGYKHLIELYKHSKMIQTITFVSEKMYRPMKSIRIVTKIHTILVRIMHLILVRSHRIQSHNKKSIHRIYLINRRMNMPSSTAVFPYRHQVHHLQVNEPIQLNHQN